MSFPEKSDHASTDLVDSLSLDTCLRLIHLQSAVSSDDPKPFLVWHQGSFGGAGAISQGTHGHGSSGIRSPSLHMGLHVCAILPWLLEGLYYVVLCCTWMRSRRASNGPRVCGAAPRMLAPCLRPTPHRSGGDGGGHRLGRWIRRAWHLIPSVSPGWRKWRGSTCPGRVGLVDRGSVGAQDGPGGGGRS